MKPFDPLSTKIPTKSGAMDADWDQNVEPLMPIWIKFWSH